MIVPEAQDNGMNPKLFLALDNPEKFKISTAPESTDCLQGAEKESKSGVKYMQFSLFVEGALGSGFEGLQEIKFLFARDLKQIRKEYGEDSVQWVGKVIQVSAKQEGDYARWDLKPFLPVVTENI